MMSESFRTFIAIHIPENLREEVVQFQTRLEYRPAGNLVRWTRKDHLHLTLEFLGTVDAQRIGNLIASVRAAVNSGPLQLSLKEFGAFPNSNKPNILWIGVGGEVEKLTALQKSIGTAAQPFAEHHEDRDFHAHLTIGRLKNTAFKQSRRVGELVRSNALGEIGNWTADKIHIMRSELSPKGPTYSELAAIPF